VKEATWDCRNLKSPSPDGYNFKFIKSFWYLFKDDVMRFLQEYHDHGVFPRGDN